MEQSRFSIIYHLMAQSQNILALELLHIQGGCSLLLMVFVSDAHVKILYNQIISSNKPHDEILYPQT